jgi:hypothetical protein
MSAADVPLSELVILTLSKGLDTLEHLLTKTEEHAKEKGIDVDDAFVEARLIEDQLPFAFQVQNATKAAQVVLGRLTAVDPTLFSNTEKTFDDLHKRIEKARDAIKAAGSASLTGHEEDVVDL